MPLSAPDKLPTADTPSDLTADAGGVDRQQADSQNPPNTLYGDHQHDPYTLPEEALDDLLEGLDQEDFDLSDVDFHPSTLGRAEKGRRGEAPGGPDAPDSDDSDGEPMRRDVDKLLSQLRDEFALSAQQADKADAGVSPTHTAAGDGPTPGADDILGLPTVPNQLPTPITEEEPTDRKSLDFENDMTTRLASLRGLGSGVNLDPFGLPVAPTFQPSDRNKKDKNKVAGYTDEDQKTWCIVCLDDATIRCVGCGDDGGDGDVYCARCWREMHLGPAAGWDERGHQWVKFVRR